MTKSSRRIRPRIMVEVLPELEYAESHLPGAISIPLKELDGESTGVLNKDAPVIVY